MTEPYDKCCGSCGAFTRYGVHPTLGLVGSCARGMISYPVAATSTCGEYRARGTGREQPAAKPSRAAPPRRSPPTTRDPASSPLDAVLLPPLPREIDLDMDIETFRSVMAQVLREELGVGEARIGARWQGGEMILRPGKEGTAEKRVPIETFFRKIVMIRDKLRVLEQRVNAHPTLSDEEKIAMQQYVTGCYGSLTTLNVLFADPIADGFRGSSKD
jgi:hypothetical protein